MRSAPGLSILVVCCIWLTAGCTPDVAWEEPPEFLEFDSEADPARIPQPNDLVRNRDTGYLDFGLVDQQVPALAVDCVRQTELEVAECEFLHYLQTLDGYPTLMTLRAPSSAQLDLATVTFADEPTDNLVVIDASTLSKHTDLEVTFDVSSSYLVAEARTGWELGRRYVAAVRGYDNGVTSAEGKRVVASYIYYPLRQRESLLSCRPDPHDAAELDNPAPDPECKYWQFLSEEVDADEAVDTLTDLETLRQDYIVDGVWDVLESAGHMTRNEAASAWSFTTHTASVAELSPNLGLEPELVDLQTLRVAVKGSVDASSLTASSLVNPPFLAATVILLDITALQDEDYIGGFPEHAVSYAPDPTDPARGGHIELRLQLPMNPAHRYGIILTTSDGAPGSRAAITNALGVPLVPSPVTVLVRSRGPIMDVDGRSLISSISDEDASDLEDGRQELRPLLDNEFFTDLAELTRENIAFIYGFELDEL